MKKQILIKIFFTFVILTLGSCRDPLFYTISKEEKQLEPLIKGSPTNFVEFQGHIYVGSGRTLYRYNGQYPNDPARGDWTPITPGGYIKQLAATNSNIYALCEDSKKYVLKYSNNGTHWPATNILPVPAAIKIYTANNQLFIGAGTSGSYSILKADGSELANTQNKLLNGVAYYGSDYYFSVSDGGIYKSDLTPGGANLIGNSNNVLFMGIINLDKTNATNNIVAISRDGKLYTVTSGGISLTGHTLGGNKFATGALAIWKGNGAQLLLAGRQDEPINSVNYEQGYLELELSSAGAISGTVFRDPGKGSPTTVDNYETYRSNMEKNPVHSLFQANDGTLFASTATNGVWSYRLRNDDKWQWNAEQ
ncbi:MAG: hypothetical protein LBB81_04935 [Treponema sp.]|jgi:hypothetical protein|nr:hypothetical protein [Treponema sp.]